MSGNSKRACKVLNKLALILVIELFCSSADDLKNYLDSTVFVVSSCDRKWDSLTLLVNTQDNKLSRLSLIGNKRSVYLHLRDSRVKTFFGYYFIHFYLRS